MKSKIKIKKSHRGLFTHKAEDHGMSVQAFAAHVLSHKESYDAKTVEQANFAHNAVDFKHKQTGGVAKPYVQRNTYAQNAQQDTQFAQEYQQPQQPVAADPLNPMDWLHTTQQGQVTSDQFAAKGFKPSANNGSNKILFTKGTGVYDDSPYVKDFNLAASAVTGVAGFLANNKLKKQEQLQSLSNNQPAYQENADAYGLNNLPMYTQYGGSPETQGLAHKAFYGSRGSIYAAGGSPKYPVLRPYGGGPLTADGAKQILTDGTVNGKKLTDKQRNYFGFIAGGGQPIKKQTGGCDDCNSDDDNQPDPKTIIEQFSKLQGVDPQNILNKYDVLTPDKQQAALQQMYLVVQQSQQDAGSGDVDQTEAQQQPLMKYGGKPMLKKKQTGGQGQQPAQQQAVSPQDQFYRDSATLLYYKNQLNDKLKAKNPTAYQNYFKGMTDIVKSNPTNPYGPARDQYIQGSDYNDYLSPDEVQKSLGNDDYQRYLNSIKGVNSYNVAQGKQPLYGTTEGDQDINKLNYGRRFASLTITPSVGVGVSNDPSKTYNRTYNYNPKTQSVDYTETGDSSLTPSYLRPKPVLAPAAGSTDTAVKAAGGNWIGGAIKHPGRCSNPGDENCPKGSPQYNLAMRFKHGDLHKQTGGDVPTTHGLPDGMAQLANVNAEEGEVYQDNNGDISKVANNAGTHEEGGVNLPNVNRVLENTSKLRKKDPASKILALQPEEVQKMFGFTPKSNISHADAFEQAKEHFGKKRLKIQQSQKLIADRNDLDPLSANAAKLNFQTNANLPTDDEMFDMLFGHQEYVKQLHGIQDDGSMDNKQQYGGMPKLRKAQAGFDPNDVTGGDQTNAATVPNLDLYKGPKVKQGRNLYTPTGKTSEAKLKDQDIIDRYKAVGVDFGNKRGKDLQGAIYNYLIDNQPDVLRQTLKEYGPNIQSEKMGLHGEKAFTDPLNASTADLKKVLPGLTDGMVGARIPLPDVSAETDNQYPQAAAPTAPGQPQAKKPATSVINPKFIKQPDNKFHEPTYWDELAPGVLSLADSMNRDPELYNRQEYHQLRYKQLDPTSTLNANQADFEAAQSALSNNPVGSGVAAANLANLAASKYKANAQTLGTYDNENANIKNKEIEYNTQVRDKQSAADAVSRGNYFRNVQIARDNQRIQRLKAIEDLGRVIQMKRRQNNSGNLVQKLSPAYDQHGDYNGYQYAPVIPAELGSGMTAAAQPTLKPRNSTKTTTSWKLGDKTIKTETRQ